MTHAVIVQGLGKQYRQYHQDRPWTLQEIFQRGFRGMIPLKYFWALRDVSFTIPSGRMVGVIGGNGAGKSTLLRLLGRVGRPDEGSATIHGRVDALLDLGAGFHPDLTGRENVFISGVINGLLRREVAKQFDSIVAFSELEEFIDSPLRTYSTGMQMRLAFAVATHTHPSVLLIDEVLAVGDLAFQRKCLDRIAQFKIEGCTIILVTHDTGLVAKMCDEAIWLHAGRVMAHGPAGEVATRYIVDAESLHGAPGRWVSTQG